MKKLLLILPILFLWFPSVSHAAWVAEDDFDSYADGGLDAENGGSGWSAAWAKGASNDPQVQGTTVYEGAKAVTVTGNTNTTRTLTSSVASGILYVAMKRTDTNANDNAFRLLAGASVAAGIRFAGGNVTSVDGGTTIISGHSTTIFYLFEVTLNGNDTYDIRYHNGTSWSSPVTGIAFNAGTGSITSVAINTGLDVNNAYIDYISPTNPITAAVRPSFGSLILFGDW